MKILDAYILKKFFSTMVFIFALLLLIFIVIDVNEKYNRLSSSNLGIFDALQHYYPYFTLWAINNFFSIIIFISVILFTSRMANQTEIVAIISSGVSFYRFSRPYFIGAILIASLSFITNHYVLAWSNIKKNEFNTKYLLYQRQKNEYQQSQQINSQLSPTEYLFINSYNRISKDGNGLLYQQFDDRNTLIHEIRADQIVWNDSDSAYMLKNYFERYPGLGAQNDNLIQGSELRQKFKFTPDELLPESYVAETMNSLQLKQFIANEKVKGSGNINKYLAEFYKRTSLPVSIIILCILALSLSSNKRRGGLGLNLALGITIAFVFIFSFQALLVFAESGAISPLMAVWLPNFIFGALAVYLYFKRALS